MTTKQFSMAYRYLSITLACLQNMTLGGVIFGWASISGSLMISSQEFGGPGLSNQYVHLMFVVGTFASCLGPLLLGFVLDYYGPRVCSLVSIAFVALGFLLFGISEKNGWQLFIPAISLIAFGGPGTQTSIIHLSNLFPTWKATATACITGSFQLSFVVFLVFDYLWTHYQMSYHSLFIGYCIVCLANAIISIMLWPDAPYDFEEQITMLEDEMHIQHEEADHHFIPVGSIRLPSVLMHHEQLPMLDTAKHQHLHEELAPHAKAYKVLKEQGFYEQLFSPEFSRLLYFFLVNSFWLNFYIGAFDVQLGDAHFLSVAELASNASLFTVVITCGAVIIPLAGAMMDIYDFPCTSFVTIIAGVVWAILLLFKTKFTLVLSFISYAVFRTFFYTFVFAYLADVMGFKYFGILAGIMFVIGGILTFLQYPIAQFAAGSCHNLLSEACDEGNWNTMNIIMMLTIFSTLYFTYKDWIHREEFKAIQANKPPQPSRSVGRNNSAKYRKLPSNEMVPLAGSNSTYGAVNGIIVAKQLVYLVYMLLVFFLTFL